MEPTDIGIFHWRYLAGEYRIIVTPHKYTIEHKSTDALGNTMWRKLSENNGEDPHLLSLFHKLTEDNRIDKHV